MAAWPRVVWWGAVAIAFTIVAVGAASAWSYRRDRTIGLETATLTIESQPAGAAILIDGIDRGKAPVTIAVQPGRHELTAKAAGGSGRLAIDVRAGERRAVTVPLQLGSGPGHIDVSTEPRGAEVFLDGVSQGRSPVALAGVAPGEHVLVVEHGVARLERILMLAPAERLTIFVPLAGWVAVRARLPLEVLDRGRRVGSTADGRLLVAAGRRRLQVLNEEFGVNTTHEVNVVAGQVSELTVPLPSGVLSVVADSPGDVWVDGQPSGRTPTGNLSVPIGEHEVLVTHPEFGDQRLTVVVGLGGPTRLSIKWASLPAGNGQRGSPKRSGISAAR